MIDRPVDYLFVLEVLTLRQFRNYEKFGPKCSENVVPGFPGFCDSATLFSLVI